MTHEEIKESLSAYFDGQLGPEGTVELSAHLEVCAECRAALDEIKAVSEGMKATLETKAPAGLAQRALAKARAEKERRSALPAVFAIAFAVLAIAFLAGVVTKKYMPSLFSNIQGMINGAASTLGSSKGNQ